MVQFSRDRLGKHLPFFLLFQSVLFFFTKQLKQIEIGVGSKEE